MVDQSNVRQQSIYGAEGIVSFDPENRQAWI
jgi:hypothetical protein